jgi:hypothetical protein
MFPDKNAGLRKSEAYTLADAGLEQGVMVMVSGEDNRYLLFVAAPDHEGDLLALAEHTRQSPNLLAGLCVQQFAEIQFLVRDELLNQRLVDRIKTDPQATRVYAMQMGGAHPE